MSKRKADHIETDGDQVKIYTPKAERTANTETYRAAVNLNVRESGKSDAKIIHILKAGAEVECDGEFETDGEIRYQHIKADGVEGYCQDRFLIKKEV